MRIPFPRAFDRAGGSLSLWKRLSYFQFVERRFVARSRPAFFGLVFLPARRRRIFGFAQGIRPHLLWRGCSLLRRRAGPGGRVEKNAAHSPFQRKKCCFLAEPLLSLIQPISLCFILLLNSWYSLHAPFGIWFPGCLLNFRSGHRV
jgi:hypothetical protein